MIDHLTVKAVRAGLQKKQFSALELTHAYLKRIHEHNPRLNAYISVNDEEALQQAQAADERIAKGDDTPVLGLPMAIKDVLSTKGLRTTAGSRMLENYVPTWDATCVANLRSAGAIFLGKTNTDEFAMGSSTENSAYGVTHNPHDESRVPGGSSGGSAVAVAANLCVVALGTDTGGSVRQPAAYCGITGLKNTYGRVSRYGLIAYGSSLDSVGVLAKNAEDAAIVNSVIAGHDPKDSTSIHSPVPNYVDEINSLKSKIQNLRIGVPKEYFIGGLQPDVENAVREGVRAFERMGAVVKEISLPTTHLGLPVYYLIATAEASSNLSRFDGVKYGLRVNGDDLIER